MRGRLIFQFLAEVQRVNTSLIQSSGDYDPDFREVKKVDTDSDGIGETKIQYHTSELIPCQIEPTSWEAVRRHSLGSDPDVEIVLIFHFRDLERMSLVATNGIALIHEGDKLVSIKDKFGTLVQTVREPPGLYVAEATPVSFGLNMAHPHRNLLEVTFKSRGIG